MHCDKQDFSTPPGLQVTDEVDEVPRQGARSFQWVIQTLFCLGRNIFNYLSSICIRTQKIRRHVQKQAKLVSRLQQLPTATSVTLVRISSASGVLRPYSKPVKAPLLAWLPPQSTLHFFVAILWLPAKQRQRSRRPWRATTYGTHGRASSCCLLIRWEFLSRRRRVWQGKLNSDLLLWAVYVLQR